MKSVVTIGLGYIGLPTSALIASTGIPVLGVDINESVVEIINKGEIHIIEKDLDHLVKNVVQNGMLKAKTVAEAGDVYLIVVPTPFKGDFQPDISYIEAATEKIIPLLKKGDLYIIESTSPVGTTEMMADLIFSKRPELYNNLFIAYCPERVLPGNVLYELIYNDRVIGGIDEESSEKAIKFYSQFVKGNLHKSNARTAEMCKLTENASRDAQIAFANELSIICDKAKIDVHELIELANKHPRVNILKPGCGVGGHCIAVDPYFIISKHPNETIFIKTAREVNNKKASWCVDKIKEAIQTFKKTNFRPPIIGLCGLAFKANIDDLRESPALKIAEDIFDFYESDKLFFIEPNISEYKDFNLITIEESLKITDILFVLVNHTEFKILKNINRYNTIIQSFVEL